MTLVQMCEAGQGASASARSLFAQMEEECSQRAAWERASQEEEQQLRALERKRAAQRRSASRARQQQRQAWQPTLSGGGRTFAALEAAVEAHADLAPPQAFARLGAHAAVRCAAVLCLLGVVHPDKSLI